jgi:DNA-binding CsgD family transcriptional regulator
VTLIRPLEQLVGERLDAEPLYQTLLGLLRDDGLHFEGACWHVSDPLTGLFVRTGVVGDVPGNFQTAIELELWRDDVAKLADVARRRVPVVSLIEETNGRPESSARWREMIRPDGHLDELRAVFVDDLGQWGSIALFRADEPFSARDRGRLADAVPLVAQALRVSTNRGAVPDAPVPGVVVVDRSDGLETIDPTARRLLGIRDRELPGAIHLITACTRRAGSPQRARMHSADGWLVLDATLLDGVPGRVAVIVQPAPNTSLVDLRLLAAGLSARESEVALCVIRGESTREIAAALYISTWTVQDHLKAVFEKTGVRSRRELVAELAT